MIIRIANTKDIASISQLYDDFYKFNHLQQPYYCAEAKESGQYPHNIIDGTNGDIFVAEIDNMIIGFIHVEQDKTPPFPSVVEHRLRSSNPRLPYVLGSLNWFSSSTAIAPQHIAFKVSIVDTSIILHHLQSGTMQRRG